MDIGRIRQRIREFSESPKNVRFEELDSFIRNHLIPTFGGKARPPVGSHYTYVVKDQRFGIVRRPGHVKRVYVESFIERMTALGLYEREE